MPSGGIRATETPSVIHDIMYSIQKTYIPCDSVDDHRRDSRIRATDNEAT